MSRCKASSGKGGLLEEWLCTQLIHLAARCSGVRVGSGKGSEVLGMRDSVKDKTSCCFSKGSFLRFLMITCSIWVRESLSNYLYLCDLGLELCKEYTYRYGKRHKSQDVIEWCVTNKLNICDKGFTEPPSDDMMPDDMGGEGDEGPVTLKQVQKLTGKLGQKLRAYASEQEMTSEDVKYVLNSSSSLSKSS